jgi:hypothetical protein
MASSDFKIIMTFPAFWLSGFLNHMGWPRKTGLLFRKDVVNYNVLWSSLVSLARAGIVLGISKPKTAINLFADLFPKRDWQKQTVKELWDKLDPSKQIIETLDKTPEEVITWIKPHFDKVGQLNNILKDAVEWNSIFTDNTFATHFHVIFAQGLIWGLSHTEEAKKRWEEQSQKLLEDLPEMLSVGLDVRSPETPEELADAMQESVNAYNQEIRPFAEIPQELINFPLIAARLH